MYKSFVPGASMGALPSAQQTGLLICIRLTGQVLKFTGTINSQCKCVASFIIAVRKFFLEENLGIGEAPTNYYPCILILHDFYFMCTCIVSLSSVCVCESHHRLMTAYLKTCMVSIRIRESERLKIVQTGMQTDMEACTYTGLRP